MKEDERKSVLDLVNQAKEGKQSAFTKLYHKYYNTVYYAILQVVKNTDVADDLASEVFTKAFLKLETYVNHISFEMWLKTIAVNRSIDFIRRTKKELLDQSLDDTEHFIQVSSSADYSPEDVHIFNETSTRLAKALTRIRPLNKKILQLRMDGLSYDQIVKETGVPMTQVKTILNYTRNKLKQLLT